jgi:hypothetical protein
MAALAGFGNGGDWAPELCPQQEWAAQRSIDRIWISGLSNWCFDAIPALDWRAVMGWTLDDIAGWRTCLTLREPRREWD